MAWYNNLNSFTFEAFTSTITNETTSIFPSSGDLCDKVSYCKINKLFKAPILLKTIKVYRV